MMNKPISILTSCFLILACAQRPTEPPVERVQFLMDTLARITVFDQTKKTTVIDSAIDAAFEVMSRIEQETSVHIDSSIVSEIIRQAGKQSVPVTSAVEAVLRQALVISEETGGAFDVTIGVVKALWRFDAASPAIPQSDRIHEALSHVDYRCIVLRDGEVMLSDPCMRIDLGGIAKGYAIDEGVRVLQEAGIKAGIVEAGGDLCIWGRHPQRDMWRIGIRHPRADAATLWAALQTGEVSVTTSGDYERYFEVEGKRYHHILDPLTGFPAFGCVSVTVVTERAMAADAYATALFVMGPDAGMMLVEETADVEAIFLYEIDGALQYRISSGLQDALEIFEVE